MQSAYLTDIQVRHQSHLERLKANEAASFNEVLPTIVAIVVSTLGRRDVSELSRAELLRIVRLVDGAVSEALDRQVQGTEAVLAQLAEAEAEFEQGALSAALPSVSVAGVAAALAWRAALQRPLSVNGAPLREFMATFRNRNRAAVVNLIRRANAEGWTTGAMLGVLRGTSSQNYRNGVVAQMTRSHETMMRTAVQHVSSASRAAVWEANSGVVIGYRWLSVLDSRTSDECRSLDSRVFAFGNGPLPPIHMNCRSTAVPELSEEADPLGGVTVESVTTYYEWLDRQSARVQDSILGPTRGRLFRNGGLSAAEFARLTVSKTFAPLTLAEMRKLAPAAFDRAGI